MVVDGFILATRVGWFRVRGTRRRHECYAVLAFTLLKRCGTGAAATTLPGDAALLLLFMTALRGRRGRFISGTAIANNICSHHTTSTPSIIIRYLP